MFLRYNLTTPKTLDEKIAVIILCEPPLLHLPLTCTTAAPTVNNYSFWSFWNSLHDLFRQHTRTFLNNFFRPITQHFNQGRRNYLLVTQFSSSNLKPEPEFTQCAKDLNTSGKDEYSYVFLSDSCPIIQKTPLAPHLLNKMGKKWELPETGKMTQDFLPFGFLTL